MGTAVPMELRLSGGTSVLSSQSTCGTPAKKSEDVRDSIVSAVVITSRLLWSTRCLYDSSEYEYVHEESLRIVLCS
jgi:hypothetical protein